ncbi:unnamed protein product [Hapterophycus canaliculatus]
MHMRPVSPTSSQGSWVVDPDDGWDGNGLGSRPVLVRTPDTHPRRLQQQQAAPSISSSPLRSWSQVPASPPAVEYPATMVNASSPPGSPAGSSSSSRSGGSRRSARSAGIGCSAAASGGLVALVLDESSDEEAAEPTTARTGRTASLMDMSDAERMAEAAAGGSRSPSPAVLVPRALHFDEERFGAPGFEGTWGGGGGGRGEDPAEGPAPAVVGYTEVDDVNAMDMDVADFADPAATAAAAGEPAAFVVTTAPGMTAAEAVEAIAEAAELRGITPSAVVLSRTTVSSPPRLSPSGAGGGPASPHEGDEKEGEGIVFRGHYRHSPAAASLAADAYRSPTPPRNVSPTNAGTPAGTADGMARVSDWAGTREVAPAATQAASSGARVPMDTADMDATSAVGIEVGVDVDVEVDVADGKYDGKHMDRLLRWTGLITAAKMGVIPILVCATVAAISTQSSGGGDRGDRNAGGGRGGGGGGRGGGGGGGTRCSSRRRPRGGGGGGGCFPDVRMDCSLYGGMPMPFCVAPSVACA